MINKIIEFTHCTPIAAKKALQVTNGKLDQAIACLLDEKNKNVLQKNPNRTTQEKTYSSKCFYPNYIPSCEINQNTVRITDIVRVNKIFFSF